MSNVYRYNSQVMMDYGPEIRLKIALKVKSYDGPSRLYNISLYFT